MGAVIYDILMAAPIFYLLAKGYVILIYTDKLIERKIFKEGLLCELVHIT